MKLKNFDDTRATELFSAEIMKVQFGQMTDRQSMLSERVRENDQHISE